ncbi:ATP-binding protein [Enterococcus pseudoavium]|uniref:ATP-binding protein n=1 Tax=Enterococcus pseudoavium TaxID=44007 RepID=A0AAE4I2E3_9ENTE|nr:ATP-binding protein [Enterococcus pseudoavium]MDT2738264.1 ATP-binding protein [Enterococcus pseudoavium]
MFERPIYLNKMLQFKDSDAVKILAGVRGSGKSSLMKLYKMHLINEGIPVRNIVYMNFEGNDYQSINNEEKLRTVLNNLNLQIQDRIYWLFDEIQLVTGWQLVINDLKVDYDCDVVVAGSDADILSDELYDWIEIPIYPLSFQEFLEVKQISSESKFINEAYSEFEKYGGMPALLLTSEELKDTVLQGIFSSSILRDVAYKSVIKDSLTLNGVMDYLVRNTGALLNASKISNNLNSRGVYTSIPTVKRYLRLLETSYLFYHTKSYDIKAHEYLKTNSKYFIVDPGLNRCVSRGKSTMENIIYIELKRRGYNIDIGYLDNREIGFVAKRLDETVYAKVVFDLSEAIGATEDFNKINDSCKKMLVSSYPQERNQTNGIEIKYIVDWLLE